MPRSKASKHGRHRPAIDRKCRPIWRCRRAGNASLAQRGTGMAGLILGRQVRVRARILVAIECPNLGEAVVASICAPIKGICPRIKTRSKSQIQLEWALFFLAKLVHVLGPVPTPLQGHSGKEEIVQRSVPVDRESLADRASFSSFQPFRSAGPSMVQGVVRRACRDEQYGRPQLAVHAECCIILSDFYRPLLFRLYTVVRSLSRLAGPRSWEDGNVDLHWLGSTAECDPWATI
jgi:hypothetical protein